MMGKEGAFQPSENYTDEYGLYLKSLIDSSVFTNEKNVRELASNVHSNLEAIHIAIDAEKDSILFYTELFNIVRVSDHELIREIVDEEKSHIRQLADLKKSQP